MIERADTNQYNVALDSQRFTALMTQKGTVGFEGRLATETSYIRQQLKTDLGERLDVAKSTFVYEIREGKLYEPGRSEPFEEVIKRGNGRNPIDIERDEAELGSFTGVVQGYLAQDDTADGTTVLIISPPGLPGSEERKNFFQVYRREGKKVEGARYYSDLTNEEYRRKIISLNPAYETLLPEKPTDVDLKSNPVIIPSHLDYSDPDKLAQFLLGKEVGMPQEQLEEVYMDVAPITTSFINTLAERSWAIYDLEKTYQAFLNGSYKSYEHRTKSQTVDAGLAQETTIFASAIKSGVSFSGTPMEIRMLADEKQKIGGGACGSGSCSTSNDSFSSGIPTSKFDNLDGRGPLSFRCPKCKEVNTRELFQYVANCQHCGSDEVLPPSLRGKVFQPGQALKQ